MHYVIETSKRLGVLSTLADKKVFCRVIESSDHHHPRLNTPVAVYLHAQGQEDGVLLNLDHPEALNLSYDEVLQALSKFKTLYVLDKKHFLHYFPLKNLIDLQLLYTLENFDKLSLPTPPKVYTWYYRRYHDRRDINKIIPIVKHYEFNEEIYYTVKHVMDFSFDESFKFFNTTASSIFFMIECEGLKVKEEEFIETFKVNTPELNLHDSIVYTQYNLYNPTSRPTNAFNTVNFAAIPHTEEHRSAIIPKNDSFVEADFDGYHIRLVASLIGYPLDQTSAHKQLGKLYFNKEDLTEEEYKHTKQINFQAIYGKTPEEYQHLEFFVKLETYINNLWETYQKQGVVRIPISNKPLTTKLKDMYPKKLFNYVLQGLESANNIVILKEVIKLLRNYRTKVILYTYDSILLDYSEQDGDALLEQIKQVLSQDGKFPVHTKQSKNLIF